MEYRNYLLHSNCILKWWSVLLLTGCHVAERHPFLAVGDVYENKVEALCII